MDKSFLRKSVFTIGNYQIIERVQAKDVAINTGQITSKDIVNFVNKKTNYNYKNPRVIFTYVSPPGDFVQNPQLLVEFKRRNFHSQKKIYKDNNQVQQIKRSASKTTLEATNINNISQLKKNYSSQLIIQSQMKFDRVITPNKKRKMSIISTPKSSNKIFNPQTQISQIKKSKPIEDFFQSKYFQQVVLNTKK